MAKISRRDLLLGSALSVAGVTAFGQSYPSKNVRILVGYAPGGPTDIVARMFAERLARELKQPVIVENVPGANGDIAARQLLSLPADGYNLLWGPTAQLVFNYSTQTNPRFIPAKDFTMVGVACGYAYIAVAPSSLPVNDLRQFVTYAKANPNKLSYASAGAGTGNHLAGEWVNRSNGLDMTHVPYKGDAASVVEVAAGHIALTFCAPNVALPMIEAGKIKALAVSTPKRQNNLPNVPTMQEMGFDFTMELFSGLVARSGLPADITQRLNSIVNDTARDPEIVQRLEKMAHYPMTSTPEDFQKMVKDEGERWKDFVKKTNLSMAS